MAIGTFISGWLINSRLGTGGNACVYKASKSGVGDGAFKQFYKTNKKALERFKSEILAMEVLEGVDGVLPLLDKFVPRSHKGSNRIWLVMPVASPLRDVVSASDYIEVLEAVKSIATTVGHMHGLDMAHRDIKPSNMLWYQDKPCLADFGLVTYPGKVDITQDQLKVGPRQTVAPEMRYYDARVDGKPADVYSLAKSLWMLLCDKSHCFDGQYSSRSSESLRALAPLAHLDVLDDLLESSTSHVPESRPSIHEFVSELQNAISTHLEFDKLSRAKWDSIRNYLLPELVPERCIWTNPKDICRVLDLVSSSAKHNHMMLPSGGGMDLLAARQSGLPDEIELVWDPEGGSSYVVKPKRLLYEIFKDSVWDYFYLETSPPTPSGLTFTTWPSDVDYEEVVEVDSGGLYKLEVLDTGEWGDAGEPQRWRRVVRYKNGAFLIVHRASHYNKDSSTYDGRHSAVSSDDFRAYIEQQVSKHAL